MISFFWKHGVLLLVMAAVLAVLAVVIWWWRLARKPDSWKNEMLPIVVAMIFVGLAAVFILSLARTQGGGPGTEEDFRKAADQSRWPNPKFVSNSLVRVNFHEPVAVVTFTQADSVDRYKAATAYKDIWVTMIPYIEAFCREYTRLNGTDQTQLTVRLNERLGLPPNAGYDTFVELTLDPKDTGAQLIRPCGDSSLDTASCKPPALPAPSDAWSNSGASSAFQEWMLRNYYSTYATEKPYPWTALGYTFDWAESGDSDEFERFGESEFVIPKGSPIHFEGESSMKDYCTPQ